MNKGFFGSQCMRVSQGESTYVIQMTSPGNPFSINCDQKARYIRCCRQFTQFYLSGDWSTVSNHHGYLCTRV